ncbi:LysM peptidoglycan-binding domain-containing protein [Niallia sp. Krafla_26]|uniref:LysM peptidoglycan-binding domain-containing protein n=1 Tax=Niallia sp. Krafla_26 TaxID=3064703 RepID=UPI003D166CF5
MKSLHKKGLIALAFTVGISFLGAGNGLAAGDYVIKKGDTLYSIAKNHHMSVEELKQLNSLNGTIIKPGQTLMVNKTITVKKGDTLYSLAKKHHTTVKKIKELNGLTSNLIYVDQKLVVIGTKSDKTVTTPSKPNQEFTIKLEKKFKLEKEEPGKSILLYTQDKDYFARIENLGTTVSMNDVKNNAKLYLQATGKVEEMKSINNPTFYKGASFHLHAFNNKIQQKIVVKKVNGNYVKFTIHYPNKEEAEAIVSKILNMLNTLTF